MADENVPSARKCRKRIDGRDWRRAWERKELIDAQLALKYPESFSWVTKRLDVESENASSTEDSPVVVDDIEDVGDNVALQYT